MPARGRRLPAPSEGEVRRRWTALDIEQREALLTFDDANLVERIRSNLQDLFTRHEQMELLGLLPQGSSDPLSASSLLTSGFEFSWRVNRHLKNRSVVVVNPQAGPVMVMKSSFLQREELLHELRTILPDFLSEHNGRSPMPRARWKELWLTDATSVQAIEHNLVKLAEQALWSMALDPAYSVDEAESNSIVDALQGDSVPFEPWMECDVKSKTGGDACAKKGKKSKKAKRKGPPAIPSVRRLAAEVCDGGEQAEDEQDDEDAAEGEEEEPAGCGTALKTAMLDAPKVAGVEAFADAIADVVEQNEETTFDGRYSEKGAAVEKDAACCDEKEQEIEDEGLASTRTPVSVAISDDEGIGHGIFRMGFASPVRGRDAFASAKHPRQSQPPVTPPGSPRLPHPVLQPSSVVRYVWNQTSQMDASPQGCGADGSLSLRRSAADSPAEPGTPLSRGRGTWTRPTKTCTPQSTQSGTPVYGVVVRNTFVDIVGFEDDDVSNGGRPTARSLSPNWQGLCDRHWYE